MRAVARLSLAATAALVLAAIGAAPASAATSDREVVTGSGDIGPDLRKFRRLLGKDNGGERGRHRRGRREINWDAVPDQFAAPNALPSDFFNARTAPRARGAILRTPGSRVSVSADASNPAGAPVRFGDINPSYAQEFRAFSAERLFSPIGSNVVNLTFRVAGSGQRAAVRGFGAVYTDVDRRESAAFTYFNRRGRSLGTFDVPVSKNKLSFLGVAFDKAVVARVRIKYGNRALGPADGGQYDVAVMDDFIYGEPQPLPR